MQEEANNHARRAVDAPLVSGPTKDAEWGAECLQRARVRTIGGMRPNGIHLLNSTRTDNRNLGT
jgi:hypothetical protein